MFKKTDKNADKKGANKLNDLSSDDSREIESSNDISENNPSSGIDIDNSPNFTNENNGNIDPRSSSTSYAEYAGFWRRFGAWNIDMMILTPIGLVLIIILTLSGLESVDESNNNIASVIYILISAFYFALQESSDKQGTIGKRISGLIVTDSNNQRISTGLGFGRFLAATLNYLTLFIGYIMIGITGRKQGLHDLIVKTHVSIIGKSSFWKWYIILLIINICAIAAAWFLIFAAIFSSMAGGLFSLSNQSMNISSNISSSATVNKTTTTKPATKEDSYKGPYIAPNIKTESYNEKDYNRILSSSSVKFAKGTGFRQYSKVANLGPVATAQGSFFKNSDNPQVWVEVKITELPNINFFDAVKLHINYVLSTNNKNLFDKEYSKKFSFGDKKVGDVSLSKNTLTDDKATPFDESKLLYGIGSVTLMKGATEDKIAGISGYIEIKLPLNVENTIFNAIDEIDYLKTTKNGLKIKIKELSGKSVGVEIQNIKEEKPIVEAYDMQGTKLSRKSWGGSTFNGVLNYTYTFDKAPATVVVTTSSGIYTKKYPFILGKKYKKPTN